MAYILLRGATRMKKFNIVRMWDEKLEFLRGYRKPKASMEAARWVKSSRMNNTHYQLVEFNESHSCERLEKISTQN